MQQFFAARGLEYNPHPELVPNSMRALQLTELAATWAGTRRSTTG